MAAMSSMSAVYAGRPEMLDERLQRGGGPTFRRWTAAGAIAKLQHNPSRRPLNARPRLASCSVSLELDTKLIFRSLVFVLTDQGTCRVLPKIGSCSKGSTTVPKFLEDLFTTLERHLQANALIKQTHDLNDDRNENCLAVCWLCLAEHNPNVIYDLIVTVVMETGMFLRSTFFSSNWISADLNRSPRNLHTSSV